ncbi:ABC transporter permease subunit [Patulibacter sp. SYSU D01012]|uniref:ABC transporter permease n=1 Tax=Patulibacter sp. SYSU D01012 TaxID=2817381 RepID=UPI001B30C4AF
MRRLRRRAPDAALGLVTALALVFLFAPVVIAVVYAFNRGVAGKQSGDFTGFTTHWFADAWEDETIRSAVGTSLRVAALVTVVAVGLGAATGIAMARHPRAGVRRLLQALVYLLLVVPEVVLGVSLLLFYTKLQATLGTLTLVAAHTPSTIAVVALVVRSRVLALDRSIEESARDLGAAGWQVVRDVLVPQLRPALVASAVLAFTYSFDNVVLSQFLTTPQVSTLPVYLFGTVHYGTAPTAYAVAATMLAFTFALMALAAVAYVALSRRAGAAARPRRA